MYAAKRPFLRPVIFFLIAASFLLAACGVQVGNTNWPGLSTDGEKLYLAYGPEVVAYDASTRAEVWHYPAEPNAALQYFAAPEVAGQSVYIGDYGAPGGFFSPNVTVTIYSLQNVDSGIPNANWTNAEVASDKIVAPLLRVDDRVFVGTADNLVLALDAANGQELWRYQTDHSIWGQPTYREGVLYVASMDRSLYAIDADSGSLIWQIALGGALPAKPVINDNLVYVSNFDNQVHAIDVATGEEAWAADAQNWVWGAPVYADSVLYYADVDGNVFAANAENGEPLWQAQVAGAVQTSPLVVGDKVYVASEGASADVPVGALTAFSAADGTQLWQQITPAPLFTTPVVVNENEIVVALTSEQSQLIAFDGESGAQLWTIAPPDRG